MRCALSLLPFRPSGEERTRRELIPFVNESVDDEDEILLALAEELAEFVPLVGGSQHAHFLLPPLESLATVDETVVRERAVASIVSVTGHMAPASVQEHLLPLLQVCAHGGYGLCPDSATAGPWLFGFSAGVKDLTAWWVLLQMPVHGMGTCTQDAHPA